jgi:hypothetical protein
MKPGQWPKEKGDFSQYFVAFMFREVAVMSYMLPSHIVCFDVLIFFGGQLLMFMSRTIGREFAGCNGVLYPVE